MTTQNADVFDPLRRAQEALRSGHFRTASDIAEKLSLIPELPHVVRVPLGQLLSQSLDGGALRRVLAHPGFFADAPAQRLAEAGVMLSGVGAHREAEAALDAAVAKEPANVAAQYFRGTLAMFAGKKDVAVQRLERAIALDNGFAQSHWVRAMVGGDEGRGGRVDRIRAGLARATPGYDGEIYFGYALFNELHDAGDSAGAWAALTAAARAKRARLQYDPAAQSALFEALCQPGAGEAPMAASEEPPPFQPVVIVGMHRSGTTLLEALLGSQPEITDGGESYAFSVEWKYLLDRHWRGVLTADAVQALRGRSLASAARRYFRRNRSRAAGAPLMTEKLPSNALNLGLIAAAIPGARFLHVVRDPVETCFSNFRTLFSEACPHSYDLAELAAFQKGHATMMAHWRQTHPDRILEIDFDAMTRDPHGTVARVRGFLGLPEVAASPNDGGIHTDPAQGRTVTSASAMQVRRSVLPPTPVATRYPAFVEAMVANGVV